MSRSLSPRVRKCLRWVFAALTAVGIVLYLLATYDVLPLLEAALDDDLPPGTTFASELGSQFRNLTLRLPGFLIGACLALVGLPVWLRVRRRWIGSLIVIAGCCVSSWLSLRGSISEIVAFGEPFTWLRGQWRNIHELVFTGHDYSTFIFVY